MFQLFAAKLFNECLPAFNYLIAVVIRLVDRDFHPVRPVITQGVFHAQGQLSEILRQKGDAHFVLAGWQIFGFYIDMHHIPQPEVNRRFGRHLPRLQGQAVAETKRHLVDRDFAAVQGYIIDSDQCGVGEAVFQAELNTVFGVFQAAVIVKLPEDQTGYFHWLKPDSLEISYLRQSGRYHSDSNPDLLDTDYIMLSLNVRSDVQCKNCCNNCKTCCINGCHLSHV